MTSSPQLFHSPHHSPRAYKSYGLLRATALVAFVLSFGVNAAERLQPVSVSASNQQSPNVAGNTIDGNLATRWSSDQNAATIIYDLGSVKTVGSVRIAWYKGDSRRSVFSLQTSSNGSSWTTFLDHARSSGTTVSPEAYDIPDSQARYVRVIGYGNNSSNSSVWTSITETEIFSAESGNGAPSASDITHPTWKAVSLALTSTAENSTTQWQQAYEYIEDINDGRGYTAGIVGFCSGTGDMLVLVQYANQIQPGNLLAKYIPKLQQIMAAPYKNRPALSKSLLGAPFISDWKKAAATSWFQRAQRDERDRVYWNQAFVAAQRDKVGALGLALYYDVSVNHGPGNDRESFGGVLATARSAKPTPAQGGNEAAYLRAVSTARDNILKEWGDYQSNGRTTIFNGLLNSNPTLRLPISWSVYGDSFRLNSYPSE